VSDSGCVVELDSNFCLGLVLNCCDFVNLDVGFCDWVTVSLMQVCVVSWWFWPIEAMLDKGVIDFCVQIACMFQSQLFCFAREFRPVIVR
jgi:hypothetical protein